MGIKTWDTPCSSVSNYQIGEEGGEGEGTWLTIGHRDLETIWIQRK